MIECVEAVDSDFQCLEGLSGGGAPGGDGDDVVVDGAALEGPPRRHLGVHRAVRAVRHGSRRGEGGELPHKPKFRVFGSEHIRGD